MRGALCRWCLILATLVLIGPNIIYAQDGQVRSAEEMLPTAESLGDGWVQVSAATPTELAPAFRDAATATYGGPEGARVRISVLVVAEGMTAIRDSWELANEYFESYRSEINYGYDVSREQDLETRALPAGCADARRTFGTDQALGEVFPIGLTLCAADPAGLLLVYASGEVGGLTGHAASDRVVELALSSGTDDQNGAASETTAAVDDDTIADRSPVSAPVEVVSYDIYFEPNEITIPANTDVTVTLPNEGVALHNFAISELDIDVDIPPGDTEEVVINAPAGEYEFICNVPGHKAAGMVGILIVE